MDSLITKIILLSLCLGFSLTGTADEATQKQILAKSNLKFEVELSQSLLKLSDRSIHKSKPDSKPKIIQFWASWCHSCGTILWDFDQLLSQHPSVEYIAVSIDEKSTDALEYIKNHALYNKYKNSFFHDSKLQLKTHFEVETIPTILILDNANSVIFRHRGHLNSTDLNTLNQILIKERGNF